MMNEKTPALALLLAVIAAASAAGCPMGYLEVGYNTTTSTGSASTASNGGGTGGTTSSAIGGSGGSSSSTSSSSGGSGGAPPGCLPGTLQPCYGGPPGTEGQGICTGGMRTCAADGMSWGPCVGDVVPQVEDCASPADEDCDGFAPECTGTYAWSRNFGDTEDQVTGGVTIDKDGNIIAVGVFAGTLDFGGGVSVTSTGGMGQRDTFVVKLDPTGVVLWAKSFSGPPAGLEGPLVAVDGGGNIVVGGGFFTAIDVGGGPLLSAGYEDVFIARLDPSGALLWGRRFGGPGMDELHGIAMDASGNAFLTGNTNDAIDFGGGSLAPAGSMDLFVAKLDADGNGVWGKRFGDGAAQHGRAVAVSGAGDVAVAGQASGGIDFGCGWLNEAGGGDLVVAKLDATGTCVWSKRFGDAQTQDAAAIAIDAAGDIIVAGDFHGVLDFGGGGMTSAGSRDTFVAKLDSAGGFVWNRQAGDEKDQVCRGLAIDNTGNVMVTGYFAGSMDFGGGPLVSTGSSVDIFLAKIGGGSGGHLWSRRFGDAQAQYATGLAADPAGNAILAGWFLGTLDFGGNALVSEGLRDIFVARFAP